LSLDWLNDDGISLPMINDIGRLNFYEAAIAQVAKDKTFVDAGAGTGLLSFLAVRYGANKVYAVERDNARYKLLCDVVEKLNLSDKIIPIHDDFLNTYLNADYCVTETIGSQIFDENILGIGVHAKQCGMCLIPEQIDLSLLVQQEHAIFYLSLKEHVHYSIQLNNRLGEFEQVVGDMININYSAPLEANEYFPVAHALPEIKINNLYASPGIPFYLGNVYDNINLTLPAAYAEDMAVVNIIWEAKFNNIVMDSRHTSWAVPAKRVVIPNQDMNFIYKNNRWFYKA
jgi:SAM-dependent methyltransferase